MSTNNVPADVRLHKKSGILELTYTDGSVARLTAEFLRVHSPSAEVRGHGKGQEILQTGKKWVKISALEPTGNYAVRLSFDDKHDSGIYSWDYLKELSEKKDQYWSEYMDKLKAVGASREPLPRGTQVVNIMEPKNDDSQSGKT